MYLQINTIDEISIQKMIKGTSMMLPPKYNRNTSCLYFNGVFRDFHQVKCLMLVGSHKQVAFFLIYSSTEAPSINLVILATKDLKVLVHY